jgi:hypothetical protein
LEVFFGLESRASRSILSRYSIQSLHPGPGGELFAKDGLQFRERGGFSSTKLVDPGIEPYHAIRPRASRFSEASCIRTAKKMFSSGLASWVGPAVQCLRSAAGLGVLRSKSLTTGTMFVVLTNPSRSWISFEGAQSGVSSCDTERQIEPCNLSLQQLGRFRRRFGK